jgi:hypothetical protein
MERRHAQQEQNSAGKEQKSCHLVEAFGLTRSKEPHPEWRTEEAGAVFSIADPKEHFPQPRRSGFHFAAAAVNIRNSNCYLGNLIN